MSLIATKYSAVSKTTGTVISRLKTELNAPCERKPRTAFRRAENRDDREPEELADAERNAMLTSVNGFRQSSERLDRCIRLDPSSAPCRAPSVYSRGPRNALALLLPLAP